MTSMTRTAIDVSELPSYAFGQRSVLWWATVGMCLIEGTAFVLLIAAYIFLRWRVPDWPPGVAPPELGWATATTALTLISTVPNELARRAAERLDIAGVRLWMAVCVAFGLAFCVTRAMEFTALNVWWDTNAYGSVVWTLLGVHTAHVITDLIDTIVLAAIFFTPRVDANRFVDASENAVYWYFVVLAWLPIYGFLYLAPRFL
jgi:heme/copper-type cytochrome/quinol oxidase subunit 3